MMLVALGDVPGSRFGVRGGLATRCAAPWLASSARDVGIQIAEIPYPRPLLATVFPVSAFANSSPH